jgi:hypothetical protein
MIDELDSVKAHSFDGLVSEDELDKIEAGQLTARAPVAFQGVIDNNLNTTFIDPRGLIEVMVRPGREYSQVIDSIIPSAKNFRQEQRPDGLVTAHFLPDTKYRVSAQTFNDNRGVLCSVGEYVQIKRLQKSAQHQRVQNEILGMREHQSQVSRESLPQAVRDKEAALRKQAEETASAYERRQADIAAVAEQSKAQAARVQHEKRVSELGMMTEAQFESMLAAKRTKLIAMADSLGSSGRAKMLEGIEADEQEERERFKAAQTSKALIREDATVAPLATRVQRLRDLHSSGVLSQDEYDRQLSRLVGE